MKNDIKNIQSLHRMILFTHEEAIKCGLKEVCEPLLVALINVEKIIREQSQTHTNQKINGTLKNSEI